MKYSVTSFRFIVFLLSISILLKGGHPFYGIPNENYKNIDELDEIKAAYKNGEELVFEKKTLQTIKLQIVFWL